MMPSLFGLAPEAAPEPFMWGKGGVRMSPQEVAAKRAEAARMMETGMDFSPVGHWTQGLARAVQGGIGGHLDSKARKAQSENEAVDAEIREALIAGNIGDDALAAALLEPAASDGTRAFAQMEYQRRMPQPQELNATQQMLVDMGLRPGSAEYQAANRDLFAARTDPMITATLPGDRFYSGRQSGLATAMGGGGLTSGGGPQVGDVEDGFRFKGGDPASSDSWEPVEEGTVSNGGATF